MVLLLSGFRPYARVSSARQELGYSIVAQQELLRDMRPNEIKTVPEFTEVGDRQDRREVGIGKIIVPDPVLGPIVTNLFGWYASGEYSLNWNKSGAGFATPISCPFLR